MLNCHSLCTLFIGTDHQQVQNVECSKRHGTVCIVGTSRRKVEAPRNGSESTKVPDKEDPQISKTEGIQADNSRKKVLQNLDIRDDTLQDIWQDFIEGKGAENPSSPIPSDEFVARYINKFMCIMIMMIYSLKH